MKLSYLIPEDTYTFFRQVIPNLITAGIDVEVNQISHDTDLVLAAILPATPKWIPKIKESGKPYILWHWDHYSFVDTRQDRWSDFLLMMPDAVDIWSCTYEVARHLYECFGLHSYTMPAWVDVEELTSMENRVHDTHLPAPTPYVLYAASSCAFGKRVDWAEQACKRMDIPLVLLKGQSTPRSNYRQLLTQCSLYLMTAFEESNGTIPAMEAACLGKPLVLADLPSSKEVFGGHTYGVHYFNNWDFNSLLATLENVWLKTTSEIYTGPPYSRLSKRLCTLNGLDVISTRIINRLRKLTY